MNILEGQPEVQEQRNIPNIKEMADSPGLADFKAKIEEINKYFPPDQFDYPDLSEEEVDKKRKEFIDDPDRYKRLDEAEKRLGGNLNDLQLHYEFLSAWVENKNVGLDPESLLKTRNDYFGFLREREGWKEGKEGGTCYIPDIALIHKLFGDDLSGRTIVEVGPGREGIMVLGYLASCGAKVVAVDVEYPGRILEEYPEVEFINGRWENIDKLLKDRKADIIYTHNMYPYPEQGGKFDRDQGAFEEHARQAMDKVLVPGGIYMGHSIESDYVLTYDSMLTNFTKQNGYETASFRSCTNTERGQRQLDEKLKKSFGVDGFKRIEECDKKARFYGYIVVAQKPE